MDKTRLLNLSREPSFSYAHWMASQTAATFSGAAFRDAPGGNAQQCSTEPHKDEA